MNTSFQFKLFTRSLPNITTINLIKIYKNMPEVGGGRGGDQGVGYFTLQKITE